MLCQRCLCPGPTAAMPATPVPVADAGGVPGLRGDPMAAQPRGGLGPGHVPPRRQVHHSHTYFNLSISPIFSSILISTHNHKAISCEKHVFS